MINLNLNRRERLAVTAGGLFVALFVLFQFVAAPVLDKREALHDKISARERTLSQILELQAEYQKLQQQVAAAKNRFEKRPQGFTLFSFLDKLAGQTGVKKHVSYMKPSTAVQEGSGVRLSRVEMELQAISLRDLTRYLYHVETSGNMVLIKRLSISRKGREDGAIDAVLQVETVEA